MTHIAFTVPATLTVIGQDPKRVDAIVHVPNNPAALAQFLADHPRATIAG